MLRSWPPPPQRPVETLPSLHPQGDHQFTDEQQQPADGMSQEGMAASVRMLPRQGSQEGGMLMRSGSREGGQGVGRGKFTCNSNDIHSFKSFFRGERVTFHFICKQPLI